MTSSDQTYWTLAQAAAWVVFRTMSAVDLFSGPRPVDWYSYMAYPKTHAEPAGPKTADDLLDKLRAGRLVAFGRRNAPDAPFEAIPAIEWTDLISIFDGPYRRLASGSKVEPWHGIQVLRADVERQWRRLSEVQGRSRFDPNWFRKRYSELQSKHEELSDNLRIAEVQADFQEETGRKPPGRTTIQKYLKGP